MAFFGAYPCFHASLSYFYNYYQVYINFLSLSFLCEALGACDFYVVAAIQHITLSQFSILRSDSY